MRQLKLRRTLTQLNQTKDKAADVFEANSKAQLIKEVKKCRIECDGNSLLHLVRSSFIGIG